MAWSAPIVSEICVGMEVTSYKSRLEIDTFNWELRQDVSRRRFIRSGAFLCACSGTEP